jgi:thiamine kinase-like enzyme
VIPRWRPESRPTTAELSTALERDLSDGWRRTIDRLARRPFAYRTSFAIEELEVAFDDGDRLSLLFKDLSLSALSAEGWVAKPAFLRDPRREVDAYRLVLASEDLGTPRFYGGVVDPRRNRYWLFIERLTASELWQRGDVESWRAVARWLARMHARLLRRVDDAPASFIRYDGSHYLRWIERAVEALERDGADAQARAALGRIAGRYTEVTQRLVRLPRTIIHGEFYPSNVLVATEASREPRVCAVDWELAAVGPGLVDLAALTAGSGWTDDVREELVDAYRAALPDALSPAPGEFDSALAACRLHLAVQWIGWSRDWSPPTEHAHDWLGDALGLAERMRL